ncbi:hypothetical protein I79_005794 [Cricetulus griseus]|uniref:Uncharacterized protein n=1 Tax=Cricetulus griseus TaxID=10029 RepID=G3H643_CRIGR|nr:hypothetical protein I79_005794 [Cricetulus griseus]
MREGHESVPLVVPKPRCGCECVPAGIIHVHFVHHHKAYNHVSTGVASRSTGRIASPPQTTLLYQGFCLEHPH